MQSQATLSRGALVGVALPLLLSLLGCSIASPPAEPTPEPPPMPSLTGRLVPAPSDAATERPDLAGALMVLCRSQSDHECIVEQALSTTCDSDAAFAFYDVSPGAYIVLYNPFPMPDPAGYWQHWEGRVLNFSSHDALRRSFGGAGSSTGWIEDGAYVVFWWMEHPLLVEFVSPGEPLRVELVAGETADLDVASHAFVP